MEATKVDRLSSSHQLTNSGGESDEEVHWVKLSRAQEQGLQLWQTKSHAIVAHSLVPADWIYKVICQNGDRILFERLPTPRPAPNLCTTGLG